MWQPILSQDHSATTVATTFVERAQASSGATARRLLILHRVALEPERVELGDPAAVAPQARPVLSNGEDAGLLGVAMLACIEIDR